MYLSCFALVSFISRFMPSGTIWGNGERGCLAYWIRHVHGVLCRVCSVPARGAAVCGDVLSYAIDMAGKSLKGCSLIRIVCLMSR